VTVANTGSHSETWRNAAISLQSIAGGASQLLVKSGSYTSENGYAAYIFSSGGILTIDGGDFVGKFCANIDRNSYHNDYNQSWIYINGGKFKDVAFETVGDNAYCGYVISGGVFDAKPDASFAAPGYCVIQNTDPATSATYPWTVASAVAQIGTTKYATLAAAIAAVPTDGTATTVTLLKDVSGETIAVNGGRNVVLDLGGHELTPSLLYVLNGTLEAKNGTIKDRVCVYGLNTDNSGMSSTFTLAQDATIASHYGVILYNYPNTSKAYDATVNINGTVLGNVWVMGNITEGDSVINVAGTVDATGQSDVGIALNGNATVNVVDGAVVTSKSASTGLGTGIEVRAGTLNVTGGTIAGQGSPAASTGNESGTTSAGAGIAVSTYEISDISVNISGGTVTGYAPLYFVNTKGTTNKELDVAVTGGTFTSNNGGTSAIFVDESEAERVVGFVANGETTTPMFSSAVAEEYCAIGFIPKDNGNGTYGVKEGAYVAQNTTTGVKYETLAAAIAAVQDNETVQLLTNITLTAGVEVVKAQGGTFVLDGAGYTITAASPLSNSKIIAVYIEGKASDASAMQLDVKNLTIESDGLKYGFVLDSMQVAMSNVVVRANGGTAFCANTHASVTIDDCTIANTGSHTESWRDTALAVSYMADVTVNSGTFTSENGWAAYIFTSGGTIDVKGGTFSGKVRSSADTVGENRGDATITISGGEFSNVELTTAHDSNLNATIAVSGGWFSAQVPAMACAEGFEPTGALADAPNAAVPYTVGYADDIIYPIEGTAGVRIALAWATNNTSVVSEGAPVTAADVPNIITALRENGANNMPKWESYVLGLNPADPTAVLRLTATAKNATTVTVTGSIDTTKFPSISNVTVTFRLAAQNGAEWTDIATGAKTPSFDVALDAVAGKVLAIFADIVTE